MGPSTSMNNLTGEATATTFIEVAPFTNMV